MKIVYEAVLECRDEGMSAEEIKASIEANHAYTLRDEELLQVLQSNPERKHNASDTD